MTAAQFKQMLIHFVNNRDFIDLNYPDGEYEFKCQIILENFELGEGQTLKIIKPTLELTRKYT